MKSQITAAVIAALLVFLFLYTGSIKILTHNQLADNLSKAPLLKPFSSLLGWLLPLAEISVACMLLSARTRKAGFMASFILLFVFTVYLAVMLLTKHTLPCYCGGIINSLSWPGHILFNCAVMGLSAIGYQSEQRFYCNKQGYAENLSTE